MIKQLKAIIFLCFCLPFVTNAQEEVKENYTLKATETGTKNYVARDYILLQNGFTYKPGTGESLKLQIDQCLLFPPNETTFLKINDDGSKSTSNTTDKGAYAIGSIPGQFNVSSSGAGVYNLPIQVPEGINGMKPQLAITYNSQAGIGLVGLKCNLSGISCFSRTGQNLYYDDNIRQISFDNKDRFVFDGQRIGGYEGEGLKDGQELYTTDNTSYEQIIVHGTDKNAYFEVIQPNGTKIEYNAKMTLPSNKGTYKWYISKVTDIYGNYMKYYYTGDTYGQKYIDYIEYARNDALTTNSSEYVINFDYEVLFQNPMYIGIHDDKLQQSKILSSISISRYNKLLFTYKINYVDATNEIQKKIDNITLTNADGESIWPSSFEWGTAGESIDKGRDGLRYIKWYDNCFGNFLNGGREEVFSLRHPYPTKDNTSLSVDTYSNKASTSSVGGNLTMRYYKEIALDFSEYKNTFEATIDLDNDCCDEVLLLSRKDNELQVTIFNIKTDKAVYFNKSFTVDKNNKYYWFDTGDFDGDGFNEIFFIIKEGKSKKAYLINKNNISGKNFTDLQNIDIEDIKDLRSGDFNGDGKSDIFLAHKNKGEFYSIENDKVIKKSGELNISTEEKATDHQFVIGDFNNDGTSDVLNLHYGVISCIHNFDDVVGNLSFDQSVYNGRKVTEYGNDSPFKAIEYYGYGEFGVATDVNQDGLLDIIIQATRCMCYYVSDSKIKEFKKSKYYYPGKPGSEYPYEAEVIDEDGYKIFKYRKYSELITYLQRNDNENKNNLNSYFKKVSSTTLSELDYRLYSFQGEPAAEERTRFYNTDLMGNGERKFFVGHSTEDGGSHYMYMINTGDEMYSNSYITKINNSYNNSTQINYYPLTQYLGGNPQHEHYTRESTEDGLTYIDYAGSMYVVTDVTNALGYKNEYKYGGAKLHREKGFLGFKSTTIKSFYPETDEPYNTLTSTNFLNKGPIIMYPSETLSKAGDDNVKRTTYGFSASYLKGFIRHYTLQKSFEQVSDYLNKVTSKVSYENYDGGGHPELINEYVGVLDESLSKIKSIETKYLKYNKEYGTGTFVSSDVDYTTTTNYLGTETHSRTTDYQYNDRKLNMVIVDPDDENELTTEYTKYDNFGNALLIKTSCKNNDGNKQTRTTSFTYYTDGKSLHTKTNDYTGFKSSYSYNNRGLLKNVTNHNGLVTTYEYDGFDRLTKTNNPDGTYSVETLQWANSTDAPEEASTYSYSETSGQSPVWKWFDKYNREIRNDHYGFNGTKIYVSTTYNSKNQLESVTNPYFKDKTASLAITNTYDKYGRIIKQTTPRGATTKKYEVLKTTTTNSYNKYKNGEWDSTPSSDKSIEQFNIRGQLISSTVNGKKVSFTYWPSGLVRNSTPENGVAVVTTYDLQGNRTAINDPDGGERTSKYNGFGELLEEKFVNVTDGVSNSITTTNKYDKTGRITSTAIKDNNGTVTTTNLYNSKTGFITSVSNGKHTVAYTYDEGNSKKLGRVTTTTETLADDSKSFSFKTTYDAFGRGAKRIYPSGFYTSNNFNKYGYLSEIKSSTGKSIWKANTINAKGQYASINQGNLKTTFEYDDYSFLESIFSEGIIDHKYTFATNANLKWRKSTIGNNTYSESFEYFDNRQLEAWDIYLNGTCVTIDSKEMVYDKHGNIVIKPDLGSFMKYEHASKPHALTSIEDKNITSIISTDEQNITYTNFNKVATITEGTKSLNITYGVDYLRRRSVFSNGLTRYYLGDYEEDVDASGNITKVHYISGGNGLAAIYKETNGSGHLYYTYADYQGSLIALTNEDGSIANYNGTDQRFAYDPWGFRRNPLDWTKRITTAQNYLTDRGYTLHEHLDDFTLINMNGRVYDPNIARFLSPDPMLQAPNNALNYNRYTYCMNNPMLYTDPSGMKWYQWLNPFYPFIETMDRINNNTVELRQNMSDIGVPDFNVGYNTSQGSFHSIGNSGNIYHNQLGNNEQYEKISNYVDEQFADAGAQMHANDVASKGGGWDASRFNAWEERSKDRPLITGSYDRYYGAGGRVGGELFGEKAFLGIHLYTVKESMMNGKYTFRNGREVNTVSKYFGVEGGIGPISAKFIYNWDSGLWDVGGSFASFKFGSNSDPTIGLAGGSLYMLGGVGGAVDVDLGKFIHIAAPIYNTWYDTPGMSVGLNNYSDLRLKENITIIDSSLIKLNKLNGYKYVWVSNAPMNLKGSDIGVLAQEVETIFPEAVQVDESTGYKKVYYYKLIPVLIEALKEQQSIIDDQNKELFELKRTSDKNKELIDKIFKHLKKEDN